ncbi:MAG: hypothetical protein ABI364_03505 [Caldimonas sp.]
MTFFGIELRKPSFNEITAATIMAVGLWVAGVGLTRALGEPLGAGDAGALLIVAVWGCVGTRLGLKIGQGGRHLAANIGISAMLLAVYQGALVLAA